MRTTIAAAAWLTVASGSVIGAQAPQPPLALRFETARAAVVVVDPLARPAFLGDSALKLLLTRCRNVMPISESDSAFVVQHRLRDVPNSAETIDQWVVSFFVVLRPTRPAPCVDREAQDLIAVSRGLTFSLDTGVADAAGPSRVAVMRGAGPIPEVGSESGIAVRLTPRGIRTSARGFARVSVPLDALRPDSTGVPTDVWLAVTFGGDTVPTKLLVPETVLASLWDRALLSRLSRVATRTPNPEVIVFSPRVPSDIRLRLSVRDYWQGDVSRAALTATRRMRDTVLSKSDDVAASVQVGTTALALGDTASARVLFQRALAAEPCLQFRQDAPEAVRQLLAPLQRPNAECVTNSYLGIGARGLVAPGFGRATGRGRRAAAVATTGAVVATGVLALTSASEARALYSDYLTLSPVGDVPHITQQARAAYVAAEDKRLEVERWLRIGAGIWVISLGEALIQERLHRLRLAAIQDYGLMRRQSTSDAPRLAPIVGDGRYGLAYYLF